MTVPGARLSAPLRFPAFRALAGGRLLLHLGNSVATVALAFAVLDLTGSVARLGLVVGARSLATVALLLLGGALSDRLPRPLMLQGSCLASASSQAAIAALVLLDAATLPLLVTLSMLNGAATAVGFPAAAAITPQTVPEAVLRPANVLVRTSSQLGMTIGMSLGGAVSGFVGPGPALAVNAALFALAALCFAAVRVPAPPSEGERSGILRDLLDGWTEFVARPWVWIVVLQFMVVNACVSGATVVLGPAIADATFGRGGWGLAMACSTAGALAGGFLAARWQPRRALFLGVALMLLESLPMLVLAEAPFIPLLVPVMFLVGVATEQFGVAWEVSLQQNIPAHRLARVYSYDALGSLVALPVGEIAVGPVAEAVGLERTMLGLAVLLCLATLGALGSRSVRSLTRR
ncbi:MFS transporter [Actinorugispora endophytica]|uniref:Putative MFS family arabinose efflux permease n=1 Tax=Actinorugispora endophytica TaxID=1605990 RepID=A0A4R6V4Q1_9ACTN|nr:MFS transporter [Actinorugispora endophytica]TDQ53706.1 putative MFS family arabinose efflux permease [Actinorugispora endophytica]